MNDDKELIWVKKEIAEEYKSLESDIKMADMINDIIRRKKVDISDDIENLDDDLIRFKGFCLNYANKFKEAYNEQTENIEKIWEDCNEPISNIVSKTSHIKKEISGISGDIRNISASINDLDTYKLDRIIGIIEKYNSMTDDDKEIFKLILERK